MSVGNALARGVFVVAAKRTPFGTFGGSLKSHSPVDLQVLASEAAIASCGIKPEYISSVCIGNVLNASSPDAPYLARHVALRCGLPVPTPALIGKLLITYLEQKCSELRARNMSYTLRVEVLMTSSPLKGEKAQNIFSIPNFGKRIENHRISKGVRSFM